MASYPYFCEKCDLEVEIVKSMHDASREECCIHCSVPMTRIWTPCQIMGAKVQEAEYNPGLGMVIKNKKHRKEVADRKGLIEVGNETPKTLYNESVVKRQKEREKEWDNL